MTTILKTKEEIAVLKECGKRLASVLDELERFIKPGVTTWDLDDLAKKRIIEKGDEPAFLNYQPYGAEYPFPASLCVSLNEEIVHGIPREDRVIQEGDIVSIDLGIKHKGLITDSARTVTVGSVDESTHSLLEATRGSLHAGIATVAPGKHINDIGKAIEQFAKPYGFGIVKELGGHSVGKKVHEHPYIPNYDTKKKGDKIVKGMVLAIEPMLTIGDESIEYGRDGYTISTIDGSLSAHFEHTILVTDSGSEIVTRS